MIPAGERLTVRAVPIAGDRSWTPTLQLFTSCGQTGGDAGANLCLASDRADAQGQRMLRYVNNGPTEQTVLLSVSAGGPVHGARFRLEVAIAEPLQNLTCASARPLSDGLVLRNQDLSEGATEASPCKPSGMPSLFYSATLYPAAVPAGEVDSAYRAPARSCSWCVRVARMGAAAPTGIGGASYCQQRFGHQDRHRRGQRLSGRDPSHLRPAGDDAPAAGGHLRCAPRAG